MSVTDDGVGFDPALVETPAAERPGGMGLRAMRERAAAASVDLTIESAPGAGTRVRVVAPPIPSATKPPRVKREAGGTRHSST